MEKIFSYFAASEIEAENMADECYEKPWNIASKGKEQMHIPYRIENRNRDYKLRLASIWNSYEERAENVEKPYGKSWNRVEAN